jgi:hypothetical protein
MNTLSEDESDQSLPAMAAGNGYSAIQPLNKRQLTLSHQKDMKTPDNFMMGSVLRQFDFQVDRKDDGNIEHLANCGVYVW